MPLVKKAFFTLTPRSWGLGPQIQFGKNGQWWITFQCGPVLFVWSRVLLQ